MNLSRNKLSKIANTKYQSRKNRPSKKKNAGASKIRTKFTKKRKIGGKGKNLRKNTMKQKIQFNKKGGEPETPAAAPKPGPEKVTTDGTQTKPEPEPELTTTEAEEETAATSGSPKPADPFIGPIKPKNEETKVTTQRTESAATTQTEAEAEAKAKAEEEANAKAEAEAKAKAKAREEEQKRQQKSTENPQGDFTVTMKLGINTQNELYVKEVTPSLDNGNPNSGNSTIASLATGKSVNETDFEQLPMKDMLKQIFDMLQKQQQQ